MANQNIRVCARFRPQFAHETAQGGVVCVETLENKVVQLQDDFNRRKVQFAFDRVFGPQCNQKTVYEETVGHMVDEVLHGYNCTVLAYGQTGSGKTYTMQGCDTARGLMPRLMQSLFEKIREYPGDRAPGDVSFSVDVSYVEIYRGQIRDLLERDIKKRKVQKLKIRHGMGSKNGVFLEGAVEKAVYDHEEVMNWIDFGAGNREVAKTNMNEVSSRSHGVVIVLINALSKNGSQRTAKLMMVDLAGSEAAKKTGATGDTLKEAQSINGDLSALGLVMNQLTSRQGSKPSYRSSKLTHLLADSLGGNCKTTLIVCASSSSWNATETISTLRFGTSAKKVKNKAKVNEEKSVKEYKEEIERLKKKVASQQSVITALKNDLSRALAGKITDISQCMYRRIDKLGKNEEMKAKDQEEGGPTELRRSPSNISLDSMASGESKASCNSDHPSHHTSDSSGSGRTLPSVHNRSMTSTSLGSIGENELVVSKDQYQQFCEAVEKYNEFGQLKIETQKYKDALVDKQSEIDVLELRMEKESKKWTEQKISLRYKNEALQRKNKNLRERFQLASANFDTILSETEKKHVAEVSQIRTQEKDRVDRFIREAKDAFASNSRFQSDSNSLNTANEQRMKLISAENSQLRQNFQERNVEYVEWKMKAFKLEQGAQLLRKKVHFQNNELKLLAEAKKEAADIHYHSIAALERELKVKRRENSELQKKIVKLESCVGDDATWIGKMRGQARNMNMRIRPRRYEERVLDMQMPAMHHVRGPSNVFTPMYTPDPTHIYRQPSMDFMNNDLFSPNTAFQTPQGPFQGFEHYQQPSLQQFQQRFL